MVFYPNAQIKDPFANEPIPMKIPSSGQVMEDPRIQRNVQAYMDKLNADAARGQAIRDALARGPYISPTEIVYPLNPEIEDSIRDTVFNPREDNLFNNRVIEAYQRKMLGPNDKVSNEELVSEAQIKQPETKAQKANNKPVSKKEQFKAEAKKSVRDWTDNSGMQYIASVNPYAAAGMGFANQMANPFKQRYFEGRADANEEEDARRLNYEIARREERDRIADERYNRQEDREDKRLALAGYRPIDAMNVNVPFMSSVESIMTPEDARNYMVARKLLETPDDADISTLEGRKQYQEKMNQRKQAMSIINTLNNKYADMADLVGDVGDDVAINSKTLNRLQGLASEGRFGPDGMANFLDRVFHGGSSDDAAKLRSQITNLSREYRKKGYIPKVLGMENIDFNNEDPQIALRLRKIKRILADKRTYLVQMKSKRGTDVRTFVVSPNGVQDLNSILSGTSSIVKGDTESNMINDITPDIGG